MARWTVRLARYVLAMLLALLVPVLGVGPASALPDGPWFEANYSSSSVSGCQFAGDVTVVVTNDAGQELLRAPGQLQPDGCFEVIVSDGLLPGMVVTVTDGTTIRTLTLVDLRIEGVNPETDTAWGYAPPGSPLHVDSDLGGTWADTNPIPDPTTGYWQADFAEIGVDLVPGNGLGADIWDGYAATACDVFVPPNVDGLASLVNDLVSPQLARPLTQRLQVVEQTLERDRVSVGIRLLNSYVVQVQGLARSGKISAEASQWLVGSANYLIIGLGG